MAKIEALSSGIPAAQTKGVAMQWLEKNFREVFDLPEPAIEWLLKMYRVAQFFDDVADGDPVTRKDLDAALWDSLIGLQTPFYLQHASNLAPLVAVCVLKWQASDKAERNGQAGPVSFVWRAGYYDLVLAVVLLCKGNEVATEAAPLVMFMYGEKLADYLKEFDHA